MQSQNSKAVLFVDRVEAGQEIKHLMVWTLSFNTFMGIYLHFSNGNCIALFIVSKASSLF